MKQYAAWQAPFYSFWSKSFYVDVAKNWHGLAYIYLLLLLCFTWLFMSIKKEMDFSYQIDHGIKPLFQQVPVITINKGVLSIDRPSPYTVRDPGGEGIVTFDTSKTPMAPAEAPGIFFVTKNTIIFKASEMNRRIMEQSKDPSVASEYKNDNTPDQNLDLFSNTDHAVIDQASIEKLVGNFKKSVAFLVFLFALPLAFVFCVIQTLIYGLIGMAIASANQVQLSYATLVRLSAVAMTPVLLIDSLLKVRNLDLFLWGPSAFIITIAYLIFAIRANISDPNKTSPSIGS